MHFRHIILALSLGSMASAAWAESGVISKQGSGFAVYGEVENYTIYANAERMTCLAEAVDAAGTVVQMGLNKDRDLGYIGVFTQADIYGGDAPKDAPLVITVNGNVYTGEGEMETKRLARGYHGGYILANNPNFVADIENGEAMIAFSDRGDGIVVDLNGTKKAIEEASACTASLNS